MNANDTFKITIDDSRAMLQIVASLTNNFRVVIYDCNMFIAQATSLITTSPTDRLLFIFEGTKSRRGRWKIDRGRVGELLFRPTAATLG
jgi:hypothetical protein